MQTLTDMTPDQQLTVLRREWWGSPAIRAEFVDNFEVFAAAKRAEERGLSRVVNSVVQG